jgi:3-hydroxypropanoate dehydrogenase
MSEALNDTALDQLFREARSYNGYLDMPVSQAQLEGIWDLMKFGPTSANCLPARIIWCTSTEAKQKLAACTMPSNGDKILQAPVTAIIGMDLEFYEQLPELFPHADARSWFAGNDVAIEKTAFRNSSLQGAYLMLAARALGDPHREAAPVRQHVLAEEVAAPIRLRHRRDIDLVDRLAAAVDEVEGRIALRGRLHRGEQWGEHRQRGAWRAVDADHWQSRPAL